MKYTVVLLLAIATMLMGIQGSAAAQGTGRMAAYTTFASSEAFTVTFYKNGQLISKSTKSIGFGADGHWTMTKCSETGTYRYNSVTDTLTLIDRHDPTHGNPKWTLVGLPTGGYHGQATFVGLGTPTAGGSFAQERGTWVPASKVFPPNCQL